MPPMPRLLPAAILFTVLAVSPVCGQDALPPFNPAGILTITITPPDSFLGFPLGTRPVRYDAAVAYLHLLARESGRVKLLGMGKTYEGREQYFVIVTSEENQRDLERIKGRLAQLADSRKAAQQSVASLVESTPAVVWLGYGIHGDELSSVDAALEVLYQLAAGTDEASRRLLRELVVCVDPMQNPDGRERFLAQMQQWEGAVPNPDAQSMHHSGMWPYGRGNHYLFDLNRDWILLTQIESRNRIGPLLEWNPQVMIDSHEMGAYDTYLFSPPREPFNPNVPEIMKKWWKVFSGEQARAFDRYGWSYYTREWNDEWYPGYGSSYALYIDAVGILYEQAGVEGSLVKRPDGTVLGYRETVHHHVVSSLANLTTAANNRVALLGDFAEARRRRVVRPQDPQVFYLLPGANPSRGAALAQTLLLQHIEVAVAEKDFRAAGLHDCWGERAAAKTLPAGTLIVMLDQPLARLAKAILEFDPRMNSSVLKEERKSLEKENDSRQYDVTAWSLPMAYGIESYWSEEPFRGSAKPYALQPVQEGTVLNPEGTYGYLFGTSDDRGMMALSMLLEEGCTVRAAKESLQIEGRSYGRGAVLLRRSENRPGLSGVLAKIAASSGITASGVNTALSTQGPDLGGNDMVLLRQPQVALVGGPGVSSAGFGALWHLLDSQIRSRTSILTTEQIAGADLQKYNIIILPSGNAQAYSRVLGKPAIGKLRAWLEAGGTVVGIGAAAAFLADTATGMSSVRLRHQALKELGLYTKALLLESGASSPAIDSVAVWEGKPVPKDTARPKGSPEDEKEIAAQDERARLFMPRGAIMRVDLDEEYWLCFGAGGRIPAIVYTSGAFLARNPVRAAGRFSPAEKLRLSGLLWPEARERWERTAFATREAKGRGQIILFAGEPNFRGSFQGTTRLLLNAILLGPGFGTARPVEW